MEQYKVLIGTTLSKLEENVNAHLKQGWLLSGGVAVETIIMNNSAYYQAVYKPKA